MDIEIREIEKDTFINKLNDKNKVMRIHINGAIKTIENGLKIK